LGIDIYSQFYLKIIYLNKSKRSNNCPYCWSITNNYFSSIFNTTILTCKIKICRMYRLYYVIRIAFMLQRPKLIRCSSSSVLNHLCSIFCIFSINIKVVTCFKTLNLINIRSSCFYENPSLIESVIVLILNYLLSLFVRSTRNIKYSSIWFRIHNHYTSIYCCIILYSLKSKKLFLIILIKIYTT
jgi:hypothetical protein